MRSPPATRVGMDSVTAVDMLLGITTGPDSTAAIWAVSAGRWSAAVVTALGRSRALIPSPGTEKRASGSKRADCWPAAYELTVLRMTRVQLLTVFLVIAALLVAAAQLMLWAVDRVVFGNCPNLTSYASL